MGSSLLLRGVSRSVESTTPYASQLPPSIIIFNLFHLGVDHALPRFCRALFVWFL
ncbi:MAG: hypothetical protein ACP5NQ_06715 [Vulcanisaeta sp.]